MISMADKSISVNNFLKKGDSTMKVNRKKLQLAMANACLNSEDLAVKAEMPRPTLNNAITGRSVRPATIDKIAKALGVPVEQIIED